MILNSCKQVGVDLEFMLWTRWEDDCTRYFLNTNNNFDSTINVQIAHLIQICLLATVSIIWQNSAYELNTYQQMIIDNQHSRKQKLDMINNWILVYETGNFRRVFQSKSDSMQCALNATHFNFRYNATSFKSLTFL